MEAPGLVKVVVLVGLIGGALALPATAGAYGGWYCGSLKGSGNWCGWPDGAHTWEYNATYYFGDPPIFVCQRLWDQINSSPYGNTCGYGSTNRIYYPNRTWGAHVSQWSGGNHTVWGYATTNRCEVINCGTPASHRRTRPRASQLADDGLAPPVGTVEPVSEVSSEIDSSFGVFGRQHGAGDVPRVGNEGTVLWGQWSALFGANVQLARRIRVDSRNGLFVFPGRGTVCLSLVAGIEGISTCAPVADARSGRLIGTAVSATGDENIVYGAVPNNVRRVTITTRAGGEVTEAVVDNGYLAAIDGAPETVVYSLGGRRTAVDVPYPSSP